MRLLCLNCPGIAKLALEDRQVPSCQSLLSALRWSIPNQEDRDLLGASPVTAQENHAPPQFPGSHWRYSLGQAQPILIHCPERVGQG